MADGRLTEIESSGEVAHTSRLIGGFEHVQHLDAGWIGERFEEGGELLRLMGWQGGGDGDAAAFDAIGNDLELEGWHTASVARSIDDLRSTGYSALHRHVSMGEPR